MVIAVDRSFSMASSSRMARARELAQQAVDAAGGDHLVVLAFDDRADVMASSGSAADARAAIAAVQPGYGATRYAAALDKAAELLGAADAGRLVVVSDLQRSGFDQAGAVLPDGIDLVVRDAGAATTNLSVSSATIDRHHVSVSVHNGGSEPRDVGLAVTADDRALPGRHARVPAGDTIELDFDAGVDVRRALAVLSGDDPDAYAADNERYAVAEPRTLPRVLIIGGAAGSKSGFFLTRALRAEGDEGADFDVRTLTGPAFSALKDVDVRDDSAIALLSTHGLDRRAGETLRRFLAAGGGVFIAAAPDMDADVLSVLFDWSPPLAPDQVEHAGVLAATDLRHPVLRPFEAIAANLGQIAFAHAWGIPTADSWRVVARFTNGAVALAERIGGPGRVLLFTSDVDRRWNDFPLHASFVPFVQETARYLTARPPVTSTYLVADVPAGVAARPGLVEREGRTIAVNVDPRESRIDRVTPAEFRAMVTRTASPARARTVRLAAETERQQNYWRYGLMLLLGTLVLEAFVGSR